MLGTLAPTLRRAALAGGAAIALIAQAPGPAPAPIVPRSERFGDEFVPVNAGRARDAIALQYGSLTSASKHAIPLEIEYEVVSDGFGVMLGFGADKITFQPIDAPKRLQIDGGPAGGRHVEGEGELPLHRPVTIRQTVVESAMEIAVDGVVKAQWKGDFTGTRMPVSISSALRSTLLVRAIRIRSLAAEALPSERTDSGPPLPLPITLDDAVVVRSGSFDDDFIAVGASRLGGAIVSRGLVESARAYEPPLAIEYRVKTDSTNVRLGYGAGEIIFNWEMNPDELRIDGGPAGGRHVAGKGRIPEGRFVTIRQVVHDDRMELIVDKKLRHEWKARFAGLKQPVRIFSGADATLTIESIRIKSLPR